MSRHLVLASGCCHQKYCVSDHTYHVKDCHVQYVSHGVHSSLIMKNWNNFMLGDDVGITSKVYPGFEERRFLYW